MTNRLSSRLQVIRAELWHLRKGGLSQLRTHRSRRMAARGQTPPPHPATAPPPHPATALPAPVAGASAPARHAGQTGSGAPTGERLTGPAIAAWELPDRPPRRALRVGVILDEFSAEALRWEWDQVELTPDRWRSQVRNPPIGLLFVESAWAGSGGAWRHALTGSRAPTQALREVVAWCRERGVPTVFWNKEDPVHHEDFIDTAALFDWVATTDVGMAGAYRERLGHDRVFTMPFAAASWIHNPVRPRGRAARDVAFAGMFFAHKFPERREQMDLLLGAAAEVSPRMPRGLEIFSRFHGGDERYQFPPPLDSFVRGALSYRQALAAYREFKVFLNVSSVPDSTTMCPRRIFEISACATPVVSTPTPAITAIFPPEELVTVSEPEEARWVLRALVGNDEWRDRMGHLAARRVLSEHTYRDRVDDLVGRLGLPEHQVTDPSVSILVSTNRPAQVEHVLRTVAQQQGLQPQLVLLAHGFEHDPTHRHTAAELGLTDPVFLTADAGQSLGACLNACLEAASGDVVAKMDDDDLYGPHYLADQLRALDYSGADLVGKHAHHVLLRDLDALVVRFGFYEHRFTHFVMGPTLMTRRTTAQELRFADRTQGEDSDFLRRLVAGGGRVYAADRFGFVQVRQRSGHTWVASDAEILANARVVAFGAGPGHVMI